MKKNGKVNINNHLDPITYLYDPEGNFVGFIENETAFCHVLAQIAKKQINGYTIRHSKYKDNPKYQAIVHITSEGKVNRPPNWLYPNINKYMRTICGF